MTWTDLNQPKIQCTDCFSFFFWPQSKHATVGISYYLRDQVTPGLLLPTSKPSAALCQADQYLLLTSVLAKTLAQKTSRPFCDYKPDNLLKTRSLLRSLVLPFLHFCLIYQSLLANFTANNPSKTTQGACILFSLK